MDFENPIIAHKEFDNTNSRIYGEKMPQPMNSEAKDFGVSVTKQNPADNYKRVPKKALNFEDEVSHYFC